MKTALKIIFLSLLNLYAVIDSVIEDGLNKTRTEKQLSVFTVVRFPNDPCGGTNARNGTCYTSTECSSRGGSASGSCASSFGVCCIFTLACGGTSSENNTYAIMSSFNVNSDPDPCTYTICKANSNICKLRIDYTSMVIAKPRQLSATTVREDGMYVGHCSTDFLTVTSTTANPPPTVCGYNTGQHMFVPASDECNKISIDIDTGNTGTSRQWEIKVTQYECDELIAPKLDCLQYHTSPSGTIASFNYDTSSTAAIPTTIHLAHQDYDICVRRESGKCALCLDVVISKTGTTASSFGIGTSSVGPAETSTTSESATKTCTGVTTLNTDDTMQYGLGDYLEINGLHGPTFASTTVGVQKICGGLLTGAAGGTAQATICTFRTPFKIGVHFDDTEAIDEPAIAGTDLDHGENRGFANGGGGGMQGFWLNYWQTSC